MFREIANIFATVFIRMYLLQRLFENKILKKYFGFNMKELTREWKELHKKANDL
jgi:hypothetical protein